MSTAPPHSNAVSALSVSAEERSEAEMRWVSFQPYLSSKGYNLRPRYQPDWVPSWKSTGADPDDCEDSANSLPVRVLDATRAEDQMQVVIKILSRSEVDREGEEELQILQHFSSPPQNEDPANHVVPCLDSFPIPGLEGGMFVVMPLLSKYTNPPFSDLSEVHDFLTQIFERSPLVSTFQTFFTAIAYYTSTSDIAPANIMMDKHPLYDEPFHPFYQDFALDSRRSIWPKYRRSQKAVRYYYIDFGYAKWFRDPTMPQTLVGVRAREVAPEQRSGNPYDPFKGDVYQLGALLRRDLIPVSLIDSPNQMAHSLCHQQYKQLNFLLPLARDMTNSDPEKRTTLRLASHTMNTHFVGLPGWRKRWPFIPPDASFGERYMMILKGLTAEMVALLKRVLRLLFWFA
ncbi:hypothetical protein FRC10_008688 [Ceratobasidium sp. 414]|nr:hypothetical protein FRC10_008688 [Ceratobasidium sp. 414]